jgi:hypothetical protein
MLTNIHNAVELVCPIQGISLFQDGSYEIQFDSASTPEERAAAQSIVDNWVEPPPARLVWSLDFMDRFSDATQLAIVTAAQSNPVVRLWYDRLLASGSVDLNNTRLIAGLHAMRDAGLLSQAEVDAALS